MIPGLAVPPGFEEGASRFAAMVLERNRRVNLVGPGEAGRIWTRHVMESASYALLLDRDRPVVDVGSGAGFPGMVLALLGFDVVMVEARRARYLFLEYALERLPSCRARVLRGRIEDMVPLEAQYTARAVRPAPEMLCILSRVGASGILVTRDDPGGGAQPGPERTLVLPCPPLDRPGVLSQYRIPVSAGLRR